MQHEEWTAVGLDPFESMKEGKEAAKKLETGKWRWAQSPGDGKKWSYFQCNAHVDCGRHVRVKWVAGLYYIEAKGKHGDVQKTKRRSNSALTFAQEDHLTISMDHGARPAGVLVSLTKARSRELEEQGENPFLHKKPEGGLQGELIQLSQTCTRVHQRLVACISMYHVYISMYQGAVDADTCIKTVLA